MKLRSEYKLIIDTNVLYSNQHVPESSESVSMHPLKDSSLLSLLAVLNYDSFFKLIWLRSKNNQALFEGRVKLISRNGLGSKTSM